MMDLHDKEYKAKQQLEDSTEVFIQEKQERIDRCEYDMLDLKCRCAECGKEQPWSDFWPIGGTFGWISRLFRDAGDTLSFFLGILVLSMGICLLTLLVKFPAFGFGVLFLLFVPSLIAMTHNSLMQKKSLKLDEDHRPEIRIMRESEQFMTTYEKYDEYRFVEDGLENELKKYNREKNRDALGTIYTGVLIAGSLIVSKTPTITNETLQFMAGTVRSVLPLLTGIFFLGLFSYFTNRRRYYELAERIKKEKTKNGEKQIQENSEEI